MPKVERERPIPQALLCRLYSKGIRLVVQPGRVFSPDHKDADEEGWIETDLVVPKRMKGSSATLTDDEKVLIHNHQPQLVHMLRYDWEFGKELIRDVHAQLRMAYPIARGCDLSTATAHIDTALERLEAENMHGLWYYLDQALVEGLTICEDFRNHPVQVHPEAREQALRK